jgi:hypothetical protein
MTHPHDRARRSAPRTIGDVAIVALLYVAALSPAASDHTDRSPPR